MKILKHEKVYTEQSTEKVLSSSVVNKSNIIKGVKDKSKTINNPKTLKI